MGGMIRKRMDLRVLRVATVAVMGNPVLELRFEMIGWNLRWLRKGHSWAEYSWDLVEVGVEDLVKELLQCFAGLMKIVVMVQVHLEDINHLILPSK